MSVRTVLEDDLLELRRSKLGVGVAAILVAATGGIGFLVFLADFTRPPEAGALPFNQVMLTIGILLAFLLPFVAMLASYSAIVHERETGSVRFLLGLPNSRLDAYAGKFLSRSLLYVVSTVVGFAGLGVVAFAVLGDPSATVFGQFALATLLYGLVFIGIGLAISAILDSEISVTVGIISVYVLFRGGWMILQWGGLYLTRPQGEQAVRPFPEWYFFLGRLNPMNAFVKVLVEVFDEGPQSLVRQLLLTTPRPGVNTVATSTGYAVVALVAWLVVVPTIGYLLFKNKDVV